MKDRRQGPRFELNSTAHLQLLGLGPNPNRPNFLVRIVDGGPRGLRLLTPQPLAPDSAVMIDTGQALILAEVCYCGADTTDPVLPYSVGVLTEECLSGLSNLHQLLTAIEGHETAAAEVTTAIESNEPAESEVIDRR